MLNKQLKYEEEIDMVKRYNCTLSDRRGEFGLCMRDSDSGRFVLFSEYEKLLKNYHKLEEKLSAKSEKSGKNVVFSEEDQSDLFGMVDNSQEEYNEEKLKSLMKQVALNFGRKVKYFSDEDVMGSKFISAKIDLDGESGGILADMNGDLAEIISEYEYDYLFQWHKYGRFDHLEAD